jgi:hypothetical protein
MFPYVRPEVTLLNISNEPIDIIERYQLMAGNYILAYTTNLPKRLIMWNNLDGNPYHVFFFMLGKFYTVDNNVDTIIYYYPKSTSHIVEEAMRLLPKRFERRTEKEEGYEYVHIPSLRYREDSIDDTIVYSYIRNLFKDVYINTKQEPGKYIYISRSNCSNRKLLNEDEIIPMLKDLGFSVYYLEGMTFIDSIRLFKSAEFVIGVHGAGLAWSVFCDPKTLVLEIYKDKTKKNHYYHLCKELDLEFWRFKDVISDEKTEQKDINVVDDGDIIVPVSAFKNSVMYLIHKFKNERMRASCSS